MIRKILLLTRTVRHLKPVQIVYQVYNRLKPKHNLAWFANKARPQQAYELLNFNIQFEAGAIIKDNSTFTFLNITHSFNQGIDWNYQAYGKLWNYNLQYFSFLHQAGISTQAKQNLLKDIGLWLKNGKLKLEPYPVALRVMNTIRFISIEKVNDPVINNELFAQLAYLNKNLEYHLLGNHLLEDAFALFMGGHFFNVSGWKQRARAILYRELKEQILNDGGHFELSPMYHQIILFRVLELADWYSSVPGNDTAFLNFIKEKAADMLSWLQNITFSNGDIPHFNDSASGIAFTSQQLLGFAQQLGVKPGNQLKLAGSGYRKYRFNNYECVVDVGAVGPSYQPGHSHSDALSFVLYSQGLPVVVDAGTSTYQVGGKRSYERSTNAHNTVEVEGANQSEVWGGFRVGRRAGVTIVADAANELTARHNGYQKNFAANHQRSFIFAGDLIQIEDTISGNANLVCRALFHFHPNCTVQIQENDKVLIDNIATMAFTGVIKLDMQEYELADGYNKYLKAVCLVVSFNKHLKSVIAF